MNTTTNIIRSLALKLIADDAFAIMLGLCIIMGWIVIVLYRPIEDLYWMSLGFSTAFFIYAILCIVGCRIDNK